MTKFILILTWIVAQPSYDGGTGVHTTTVEFSSQRTCEIARSKMLAEAARYAEERRPYTRLSAVCVEA